MTSCDDLTSRAVSENEGCRTVMSFLLEEAATAQYGVGSAPRLLVASGGGF